MPLVVIAQGTGDLSGAKLEAALLRAQRHHPVLQVDIGHDADGFLQFIWQEAPTIPLSLLASDEESWMQQLAAASGVPVAFSPSCGLVRVFKFELQPERWVLALLAHHSLVDARAGCHLLADILADAGGVPRPERARFFPPPLHVLLRRPASGWESERVQRFRASKTQLTQKLGAVPKLDGFTIDEGPTAPRYSTLRLDPDSVTRLLQRCAEEKTTLAALMSSAHLTAVRDCFGDQEPRAFSLLSPVDLRGTMRPPVSVETQTPAMYASMLSSMFLVRPGQLWDLAREIGADVAQQMADGHGPLFFTNFPQAPATADSVRAFATAAKARPQTVMVSNLGRLPTVNAGALTIESMSAMEPPPINQILLSAATIYNDSLTVHIAYDSSRLDTKIAVGAIDGVAAYLRGALAG